MSEFAKVLFKAACVGREGYCSSDLQDAAIAAIDNALNMAEDVARSAKLPEGYQWSEGNQQKFYFGAERAADKIKALRS